MRKCEGLDGVPCTGNHTRFAKWRCSQCELECCQFCSEIPEDVDTPEPGKTKKKKAVQETSGTTRLHSNCDPMTSHWSLIEESEKDEDSAEEDEGSADEGEVAELHASGTESGEGKVAELNASDTEPEFEDPGPEKEDKSRPWPCTFCPHSEMIAYIVLTNGNLLCCQLIRHSMSPELVWSSWVYR
jgi:hypothetical protein